MTYTKWTLIDKGTRKIINGDNGPVIFNSRRYARWSAWCMPYSGDSVTTAKVVVVIGAAVAAR